MFDNNTTTLGRGTNTQLNTQLNQNQPKAKMLSILFTVCTTVLYNMYLQAPNRGLVLHYLLYSYALSFLLLSLLNPSTSPLLGFLNFVLTESYGSLITAHFWAYCNAHVPRKDQSKAYPLIIALAQVGAAMGGAAARGGEDMNGRYFVGGVIGPLSASVSLYAYESKVS